LQVLLDKLPERKIGLNFSSTRLFSPHEPTNICHARRTLATKKSDINAMREAVFYGRTRSTCTKFVMVSDVISKLGCTGIIFVKRAG